MTYTQARLIIWNPETYSQKTVREAALFILGKLDARQEDVDRACGLL